MALSPACLPGVLCTARPSHAPARPYLSLAPGPGRVNPYSPLAFPGYTVPRTALYLWAASCFTCGRAVSCDQVPLAFCRVWPYLCPSI